MPRQVKSSENELFALCDEIQAIDGKVTAARLREAAGGGGHIRLKAVVEAWRERRNGAAEPAEDSVPEKAGRGRGQAGKSQSKGRSPEQDAKPPAKAVRRGAGVRLRTRGSRLRMPSRLRLRWRRERSKPHCPVRRLRRPRHRASRMCRRRLNRPRRRLPKPSWRLLGRKVRISLHWKLKKSASRNPAYDRQQEQ